MPLRMKGDKRGMKVTAKRRKPMIVTIDFETTGLQAGEDEVLQVSIIDENYNVLLNEYCKPQNKKSWEAAQQVNGITQEMVINKSAFEKYVPVVRDIVKRADHVIAYNAAFEDGFLKAYGIEVPPEKWIDPMIMFAEIYGEWNANYGDYKWQSLGKCAAYYGYEFKAHDSLEDVKATMYCYEKMVDQEEEKEQGLSAQEKPDDKNHDEESQNKVNAPAEKSTRRNKMSRNCKIRI